MTSNILLEVDEMIKRIVVLAAIGFVGMAQAAGAATPPSLYSASQAAAGADIYTQNCAGCHGAALQGGIGPALTGTSFAAPAGHTTLGGVFTILAQQMPADRPGGLSHGQYENVMAYILSKNGYAAGSAALGYQASLASSVPLVSQAR
jgi:mono/diheme cytochrome c family protein